MITEFYLVDRGFRHRLSDLEFDVSKNNKCSIKTYKTQGKRNLEDDSEEYPKYP